MKHTIEKPHYYRTPLTKRKEIAAFIFDNTHQNHEDRAAHPFCFNVKCYDYDVSFGRLLALYREQEGDAKFFKSKEWLAAVQARYEEIGGENTVYDWAIEDARDYFYEGDTFCTLWDGTELDVKYAFKGRMGGWLTIIEFEGFKVSRSISMEEWREILDGTNDYQKMPLPELRKLYTLIVQLLHDVRPEAVKAEIEHQAMFNFFENACADIHKPEFIQLELFSDAE